MNTPAAPTSASPQAPLRFLAPGWFAIVMGLCGLSLAWHRATPLMEASGGVNLDTVAAIAESGVDFVSVGYVTHSAPSLDLGLDFSVE